MTKLFHFTLESEYIICSVRLEVLNGGLDMDMLDMSQRVIELDMERSDVV